MPHPPGSLPAFRPSLPPTLAPCLQSQPLPSPHGRGWCGRVPQVPGGSRRRSAPTQISTPMGRLRQASSPGRRLTPQLCCTFLSQAPQKAQLAPLPLTGSPPAKAGPLPSDLVFPRGLGAVLSGGRPGQSGRWWQGHAHHRLPGPAPRWPWPGALEPVVVLAEQPLAFLLATHDPPAPRQASIPEAQSCLSEDKEPALRCRGRLRADSAAKPWPPLRPAQLNGYKLEDKSTGFQAILPSISGNRCSPSVCTGTEAEETATKPTGPCSQQTRQGASLLKSTLGGGPGGSRHHRPPRRLLLLTEHLLCAGPAAKRQINTGG